MLRTLDVIGAVVVFLIMAVLGGLDATEANKGLDRWS